MTPPINPYVNDMAVNAYCGIEKKQYIFRRLYSHKEIIVHKWEEHYVSKTVILWTGNKAMEDQSS